MKSIYAQRINYTGSLERLIKVALKHYDIGTYAEHLLLKTGYEDLNIRVETNEGYYLFKFFAQNGSYAKSTEDTAEYVGKIIAAEKAGVECPHTYKNVNGKFLSTVTIKRKKFEFMVQAYIFTEKNATLTLEDMEKIARICAQLHQSTYQPKEYYDEWNIMNFAQEFPKLINYAELPDRRMLTKLKKETALLSFGKLPKSFVHADLIRPNLLKSRAGNIYPIDFSVAFYGPRILDLAVIASNITYFPGNETLSRTYLTTLLREYQRKIPLTSVEKEMLPIMIQLCFGMYILLASKEIKAKKAYNDEDYFWRETGRSGLKSNYYKNLFTEQVKR